MRIAYADPPYIGQAKRLYAKHDARAAEVDHAALIAQLERDYDGWALSLSSLSLRTILALCPDGVRVCAWVKPFCAWKSINPAYAWEPVIIKQPRKITRPHVRDYHAQNMTTQRGMPGAKPEDFCFWIFCLLNAKPEDEFFDLFPGTGAVSAAWERWRKYPAIRAASKRLNRQGELWQPAS